MLADVLRGDIDILLPTRKQRIKAGTPLKHFLRPIIEEDIVRRQRMMQPQMNQMRPPTSPLRNALMNMKGMV